MFSFFFFRYEFQPYMIFCPTMEIKRFLCQFLDLNKSISNWIILVFGSHFMLDFHYLVAGFPLKIDKANSTKFVFCFMGQSFWFFSLPFCGANHKKTWVHEQITNKPVKILLYWLKWYFGLMHKTLGKYVEPLLSKHIETLISKRERNYV